MEEIKCNERVNVRGTAMFEPLIYNLFGMYINTRSRVPNGISISNLPEPTKSSRISVNVYVLCLIITSEYSAEIRINMYTFACKQYVNSVGMLHICYK